MATDVRMHHTMSQRGTRARTGDLRVILLERLDPQPELARQLAEDRMHGGLVGAVVEDDVKGPHHGRKEVLSFDVAGRKVRSRVGHPKTGCAHEM
jgi:hypothetical protein